MSQQFHLDFVRPRRPAGAPGFALLVVGLLTLGGLLAYDRGDVQVSLDAVQARIDASQRQLAARHPEVPKADLARFESDRKEADKASTALNRPWKALLDTLESLAEHEVALLALDPDVVKGEVSLQAEARNLAAMSEYYHAFQRLDGFSDVVLRTHQTNFQDADKPVRFRLTFKWTLQP